MAATAETPRVESKSPGPRTVRKREGPVIHLPYKTMREAVVFVDVITMPVESLRNVEC